MISRPLISIVVLTYKSAPFVRETLDSILQQSYDHWELIIADDCSPDNTQAVCQTWIDEHRDQLAGKRAEIIPTPKNGGIVANINHALDHIQGEWLKCIAGDDWLLPTCLEHFLQCVQHDPEADIALCKLQSRDHQGNPAPMSSTHYLPIGTAKEQLRYMLSHARGVVIGPTVFIRSAYAKQVRYDTRFPMLEDYTFLIRYIADGKHAAITDDELVAYRMNPQSVSSTELMSSASAQYLKDLNRVMDEIVVPLCWRENLYSLWFHHLMDRLAEKNRQAPAPIRMGIRLLRKLDRIRNRNKKKQ